MLGIGLKILSILGIILLILLAVLMGVVLLILFFPLSYRVYGVRNEAGMEIQARARWLLGLLRMNWDYPDSGRLKVKVLFFTIYDKALMSDEDGAGAENPPEKRKRLAGKRKKTGQKSSRKNRQNGEGKSEETERQNAEQAAEKNNRKNAEQAAEKNSRKNAELAAEKNSRKNAEQAAEKNNRKNPEQIIEKNNRKNPEKAIEQDNQMNSELADGTEDYTGDEDSLKTAACQTADDQLQEGKNQEDGKQSGSSFWEKISAKIEKIKYTIRNIYDKIKKIWKNISHYIELLQEEETRELTAEALTALGKILKSIRPGHIRADLRFGTGAPDTTGYVYGIYCMLSASWKPGCLVTPDFEKAVLEGEFEISGRITLWVLLWNGLKMFKLIRKLTAAKKTSV